MPLFLFIFRFYNIQYRHSFNHIYIIHFYVAIRRGLSPSPHRFVSSVGKTLPVVPSRESNSGLPYGFTASRRATNWATPNHKEPRRSISYYFCLMIEGSGSGSVALTNGSGSRRPKNIWIRRIRIRNTAWKSWIVHRGPHIKFITLFDQLL